MTTSLTSRFRWRPTVFGDEFASCLAPLCIARSWTMWTSTCGAFWSTFRRIQTSNFMTWMFRHTQCEGHLGFSMLGSECTLTASGCAPKCTHSGLAVEVAVVPIECRNCSWIWPSKEEYSGWSVPKPGLHHQHARLLVGQSIQAPQRMLSHGTMNFKPCIEQACPVRYTDTLAWLTPRGIPLQVSTAFGVGAYIQEAAPFVGQAGSQCCDSRYMLGSVQGHLVPNNVLLSCPYASLAA